MNTVHVLQFCFFKIILVLPKPSKQSRSLTFSDQNPVFLLGDRPHCVQRIITLQFAVRVCTRNVNVARFHRLY
jgi:hypothetical protein